MSRDVGYKDRQAILVVQPHVHRLEIEDLPYHGSRWIDDLVQMEFVVFTILLTFVAGYEGGTTGSGGSCVREEPEPDLSSFVMLVPFSIPDGGKKCKCKLGECWKLPKGAGVENECGKRRGARG